ncbi:hypothetical protein VmeM32_00013 [Vibrio phage vB_VmeM-32]|nr:hypothetical protein VmeM32_00013 [Vibrio phage vB_VmeM-32]
MTNIFKEIDEKAQIILDTVSSKREQKNELETYGLQFGINLNKKNVFEDMILQLKEHVSTSHQEHGVGIDSNLDVIISDDTKTVEEISTDENTRIEVVDCNIDLNRFGFRRLTDRHGAYYFADLHERFVSAYQQFKASGKSIDDFIYQPEQRITLSQNDINLIHDFVRISVSLSQSHRVKLRGSRNGNIIDA